MAVAYFYACDRDRLLAYMDTLRLTDTSEEVDSVPVRFGFSDSDIRDVRGACDTLLTEMQTVVDFFTAGGPMASRKTLPQSSMHATDHTAFVAGGVFPHVVNNPSTSGVGHVGVQHHLSGLLRLSETSETDWLGLRHPRVYFAPHQSALQSAYHHLSHAVAELRRVNRAHCYIWTTNIPVLTEYVRCEKQHRRFHVPLAKPLHTYTAQYNSNQSVQALEILHSHAGGGDPVSKRAAYLLAGEGPMPTCTHDRGAGGDTEESNATSHALLLLPDDKLPSSAVQDSYARFIQTCGLLLEWLSCTLSMLRRDDDVPVAGTFAHPVDDPPGRYDHSPLPEEGPTQTCSASGEGDAGGGPDTGATTTRVRIVRVRRYEIHDVQQVYSTMHEQAGFLYAPEFTHYDARVQRRLLHPSCFYVVRDLIAELTKEICSMENLAAGKRPLPTDADSTVYPFDQYASGGLSKPNATASAEEPADVIFRPPLSQFRFLRDSLRVYLSTSLNEDDLSSLLYYRHLYADLVVDAREVVATVRKMPRPPASEASDGKAFGEGHPCGAGAGAMHPLIVSEKALSDRGTCSLGKRWCPSAEERGRLFSGFESFCDVRNGVVFLKENLERDCRKKNRTHRTFDWHVDIEGELDEIAKEAERWHRQINSQRVRRGVAWGIWAKAKESMQAVVDAATCQAEFDPLAIDNDRGGSCIEPGEVALKYTTTSPFAKEKSALLEEVRQLAKVVEVQASQMERAYPGMFYRDSKQKWAGRLRGVMSKVSAATVVFDPERTHERDL